MLAADEERGTLDALRFSLASEIVELVVLTGDEVFLQTLREVVGSARRLWHVLSADKVSDLMVAGEVGILVLDVQALNETAAVFVGQIKRQFPDLVVVVAGNRDAETSLAGLISAGIVYRFIHKPMSPGRAKLFADAAVKKYDEQRRRSGPIPPIKRQTRSDRGVLVGGTLSVLSAIVVIVWVTHRSHDVDASAQHAADVAGVAGIAGIAGIAGSSAEFAQLSDAAAALAADRLTEPPGDNALALYSQALARNPVDPIARAGLTEVRERLSARAENALLEERLEEAVVAIETARKSGVESGRVALLKTQLAKLRERVKSARAAARARNEPKAAEDKVPPLQNLAAQRIDGASLIDPRQEAEQGLLAADDLTLVKSVKPIYPIKASLGKIQGWVELDFTVAESGSVTDIAVHAASAPGVFEDAAISALSQWRYKPVERDAKSVAQRARIRIHFALAE